MDVYNLPDRRLTGAFKWDLARPGEIPLWVADMDFPVAPEITAALSERLRHPVFGYSAVPEAYLEAFCAWQERRNSWPVTPEQLTVVPGVMPAISLLVEACTRPGDSVAIFSPVYFPFFEVVEQLGRRVVRVPLVVQDSRQMFDPAALDEAVRRSRLLLLCSPHNPGGRVWTREELHTVSRCARRHGVRVISDEIHADLTFPGETFVPWHTIEGADPGDVVLQAPSKTFNIPGLPTAMAVIPEAGLRGEVQRLLHARKQDLSNVLTMTAARAAYQHGERWLEEVRTVLHANYRTVRATLASTTDIEVYVMEGTFIAWINCHRDSRALDAACREQGVWLSRGRQFGPEGEGHMRLNFATSPALLREGLDRFQLALESVEPAYTHGEG